LAEVRSKGEMKKETPKPLNFDDDTEEERISLINMPSNNRRLNDLKSDSDEEDLGTFVNLKA